MLGDAPYETCLLKHVCHSNVEVILAQAIICFAQDELARVILCDSTQGRSQIDGIPGKLGYSITELFDVAVNEILASDHLSLRKEVVQRLTASLVSIMGRRAAHVSAKGNPHGIVCDTDQIIAPAPLNASYVQAYLSHRPSWQ